MAGIRIHNGEPLVDGVRLAEVAEGFGTPTLVYSRAEIESRISAFQGAFAGLSHLLCYSVKANNILSILSLMANKGTGFDVVSGNELERVLRAGGEAAKVVFSGVGKLAEELDFALKCGVFSINVESVEEFELLEQRAALSGIKAPVSVRVNPDIRVSTHPFIATGEKSTKFGVSFDEAASLLGRAQRSAYLQPFGVACHLGSQIVETEPLEDACARLLTLVDDLLRRGIKLSMLDLGGGFGVRYRDESEFDLKAYAHMIGKQLKQRELTLVTEPGRYLVAGAGVLLTRVIRTKSSQGHHFAVIDAAMNDLIRPSLYQAYHEVGCVQAAPQGTHTGPWEIVGPICETADTLGVGREIPIVKGDLLYIESCGAYVSVLSSNYNARDRVAEVLVEPEGARLIRRRECLNDQLSLETPFLK